eukprot:CAMPEP_0202827512 /NCGR_PEP_ID=MMETSP1389-20130828/14325_1 /ASSEMBLY_ACC=CAM_ASM_000865 /TAXON_ID=302021 /ORGANISM="Rhodomonas sp., Strain CCMP768" /LENGTH=95 /DNA_ID=CAMNT_0049500919 /DNA_START=172 /DNA_END=455 /DNA_ORIENTATION=-
MCALLSTKPSPAVTPLAAADSVTLTNCEELFPALLETRNVPRLLLIWPVVASALHTPLHTVSCMLWYAPSAVPATPTLSCMSVFDHTASTVPLAS